MMTLFSFLPFVDDKIDFERIGKLKIHYDSVYSNLTVKNYYTIFADSSWYWENWDKRSIIVRIKKGGNLPSLLSGFGIKKLENSPSYLIEIPEDLRSVDYVKSLLYNLNKDPNVEFAEPNLIYRVSYWPNDPYMGRHLWGMWVIYADKGWDITKGSRSVKVCVIDQGVDYYHEDLQANYGYGKDFVDNDDDPYPVRAEELHGTHVAGTIAGVMDNGVGVVGVAQNLILSCRALNDDGSGTSTAVAQCIRWCADTGAKVINMSLGSPAPSSEIESAVNYAVDTARVVAIAAAGNDGASSLNYPAAYPAVISVGAIDTSGRKAYFSNYGSNLDVVAPGVYILSTVPYTNRYMFLMGTSMATPHVSGLAGLILSKNPNLSPSEVRAIITGTAIDMGEMGKDWFYGYGLINVYRALLATPSPVLTSDTREGNIRVKVSGRKVVIEGIEEFKIYSSDGRFVFSGKEFEGSLNAGIYFVKGEREVLKFVVR